jgi:phosphoribosylanthranilate isomerase
MRRKDRASPFRGTFSEVGFPTRPSLAGGTESIAIFMKHRLYGVDRSGGVESEPGVKEHADSVLFSILLEKFL